MDFNAESCNLLFCDICHWSAVDNNYGKMRKRENEWK